MVLSRIRTMQRPNDRAKFYNCSVFTRKHSGYQKQRFNEIFCNSIVIIIGIWKEKAFKLKLKLWISICLTWQCDAGCWAATERRISRGGWTARRSSWRIGRAGFGGDRATRSVGCRQRRLPKKDSFLPDRRPDEAWNRFS